MPLAAKQTVSVELSFPDEMSKPILREIPNTRTSNLRTKICQTIDQLLMQYSTTNGAVILIRIEHLEADEFGNPEQ